MLWSLLILAAVLAGEVLWRLPLLAQLRAVVAAARKSAHVLASSKVSDHWKERVLPAYAWRIGRGSVRFFALLCLGLMPVVLIGLAFPGGLAAWGAALMRPAAIAVLCAVSLIYLWLRGHFCRARGGAGA